MAGIDDANCWVQCPKTCRSQSLLLGASVGRTIDKATWQITPQIGFKHPDINAHARIRWIRGRPMGRAATVRAMPCVERTITVLVGNALSLDRDQVR
jgi:hypothetical protein